MERWKATVGTISAELWLGDCWDLFGRVEEGRVDVTITDPPYDLKTHSGAATASIRKAVEGGDFNELDFDELSDGAVEDLTKELLLFAKTWTLVFCPLEWLGRYQAAAGLSWVRSGIWDRVVNAPQLSGDRPAQGGEGLAIMHRAGKRKRWRGGGKAAIWRYEVERGRKQHPTQKPERLLRDLVDLFSEEGATVFDPFAGSGTTGVAAVKLGRSFIGFERDRAHFETAKKRISSALDQVSFLSGVSISVSGGGL